MGRVSFFRLVQNPPSPRPEITWKRVVSNNSDEAPCHILWSGCTSGHGENWFVRGGGGGVIRAPQRSEGGLGKGLA